MILSQSQSLLHDLNWFKGWHGMACMALTDLRMQEHRAQHLSSPPIIQHHVPITLENAQMVQVWSIQPHPS